jgi:hypothetical protein
MFWEMKKQMDDARMANEIAQSKIDVQNKAAADAADLKRKTSYSTVGIAALATAGYAGYSTTARPLGGQSAPLGA